MAKDALRHNSSIFTLTWAADSAPDLVPVQLLNDYALVLIQWILFSATCQIISIFGTGTNIINIICFIKQGFKDSVNVSLLGLAVSDLGGLTTTIWVNISNTPTFETADLTFDPIEFNYVTMGMLHVSFCRVTCFITAFITLERCLCITAPLKVRMIITKKTTSIIIISIFVFVAISSSPVFAVNHLGLKFFPHRNRTLLGLVSTEHRRIVESITFVINNQLLPLFAFVVIITCTVVLVLKLYSKIKWRVTSAINSQSQNISSRNVNVAKMVMMISVMFIACFIPISIIFLFISIIPGFTIDGINRNMMMLIGALALILESINSSMNIFIYYLMSSRFREVFRGLFCGNKIVL